MRLKLLLFALTCFVATRAEAVLVISATQLDLAPNQAMQTIKVKAASNVSGEPTLISGMNLRFQLAGPTLATTPKITDITNGAAFDTASGKITSIDQDIGALNLTLSSGTLDPSIFSGAGVELANIVVSTVGITGPIDFDLDFSFMLEATPVVTEFTRSLGGGIVDSLPSNQYTIDTQMGSIAAVPEPSP
ncbi:MAG: hypothetical protein KDB27_20190, partial [Planctomycetales bacterium]|nr:hypothetical protein [Planctomycetales bacterium]